MILEKYHKILKRCQKSPQWLINNFFVKKYYGSDYDVHNQLFVVDSLIILCCSPHAGLPTTDVQSPASVFVMVAMVASEAFEDAVSRNVVCHPPIHVIEVPGPVAVRGVQ